MVSKACQEALHDLHLLTEDLLARGERFDVQRSRITFKLYSRPDEVLEEVTFPLNGIRAEWVCDPASHPDMRLLYLHGGGYILGDLDTTAPFAQCISKATGCAVLIIEYRLAPEHPYPHALEDAVGAFRWLRQHGPQGAHPAKRMCIAGDSAGGGLTLSTLLRLRDEKDRLPECAFTLSAITDLSLSGASLETRAEADPVLDADFLRYCAGAYAGGTDPTEPYLSPLFAETGGLPPLFMQVGEREILLDDTRRFAEKARAEGVDVTLDVWPEMFHAWQMFAPAVPEATEALDRVGRFVKDRLHTHP